MAWARSQGDEGASGGSSPAQDWLLLTDETLAAFQERWDRVQEEFVLNPDEAAIDAENLIRDIAEALAASTVRRKTDLARVDTEGLRFPEELWITLQRCRLLMTAVQSPAGPAVAVQSPPAPAPPAPAPPAPAAPKAE